MGANCSSGTIIWWEIPLHSFPAHSRWEECLSKDEIARRDRFATSLLRQRFYATRVACRGLLGNLLSRNPAGLEFVVSAHGKPSLRDIGWQFNVTHSEDIMLLAASASYPVGIDVEYVKRRIEIEAVGRRFFLPEEMDAIDGDHRRFLQVWTAKEAVLKALGTGIAGGLEAIRIDLNPVRLGACTLPGGPVSLQALTVHSDYIAALAAVTESKPCVEQQPWPGWERLMN